MHPIDKLIAMYTTPTRAGRAIGVSRQVVEHWVKKDFIPFEIAWMIEQKTGGNITRSHIWADTDEKKRKLNGDVLDPSLWEKQK